MLLLNFIIAAAALTLTVIAYKKAGGDLEELKSHTPKIRITLTKSPRR
jgi:hypothetical protein